MICVYHNKDLDGMASAAIVKSKYPDCQLIGWDYGQPLPDLPEPEEIIMVDITFPIPVMRGLRYRLTIIDHHKSFIDAWNESIKYDAYICKSKLEVGRAACELTWEYIFPDKPVPAWVTSLGEYDTWRDAGSSKWLTETLPFQYGMRSIINKPEDLFDQDCSWQDIIAVGTAILKYVEQTNLYNCTRNAFVINFEGYKTICLNDTAISTDTFKSIYDESIHDLMLGFSFSGKFWNVSLRSTGKIDCSVLAQKYGGGGHLQAAGFEIEDINTLIKS